MENQEWQQIVESLIEAKRSLADAWRVLDGTDGAASGVEHALGAALSSIDALYAIEHVHAFNQDVASPVDVQRFWSNAARYLASRQGRAPGQRRATCNCQVRRDHV